MSRLAFSAVVGQDEAKLALLLATLQPRLGGVLLRGEKGTAKTTLARGLAALRPGAPFVELPLGATEDRVLGHLDVAALLADGTHRFTPGLLAAAHGGVLYVDEINLLADHLVDALLDASATGEHRVEREGVAHAHPARFVLVGSMNPEEGELRPQLLDRFGLAVDVRAPLDADVRALAVRRQLEAERELRPEAVGGDDAGAADDDDLAAQLAEAAALVAAGGPALDDDIVRAASTLALAVGAEGLRADLMLCRAAAAHAAWRGGRVVEADDLRVVATAVLAHRQRRNPFDEPGLDRDTLDRALDEALDPAARGAQDAAGDGAPPSDPGSAEEPDRVPDATGGDPDGAAGAPRSELVAPASTGRSPIGLRPGRLPASTLAGRRAEGRDVSGRAVRDRAWREGDAIAARPTAVAAAVSRAGRVVEAGADRGAAVSRSDLRATERIRPRGTLVVVVVDTSGSMGADRRIAAAKGAVMGLLADAYQRRDRVALVACGGGAASVVLRPTGSVEVARSRLSSLAVGGTTPLAPALDLAGELCRAAVAEGQAVLLVVLTDGRPTAGGGLDAVAAAAGRLAGLGVEAVVVDAEGGPARLGLAGVLATQLAGDLVALDALGPAGVEAAVRSRLR